MSDGGDNSSRHTGHQIDEAVREGDVQIYALALPSENYERIRGYQLLQRLSEQGGGLTFRINVMKDLPEAVRKINLAIRHQYVLGYYVPDSHSHGEYRHVTVTLRTPTGWPGLHAHWRPGYYESRN